MVHHSNDLNRKKEPASPIVSVVASGPLVGSFPMAFSPPQWGNVPNAPEAQVGLRVELQVDFGDEPWVKGIVEGFSPSRQRHFIVFDDPSPDYSIDDQPRHGLSVGLTVCFF